MPVKSNSGFSLISIVMSIILISFALLMVTTTMIPTSQYSAELIYSTKAAELGSAVMDEVIGRQFDQNSGPNGGVPECNSPAGELCTIPENLGPDTDLANGIDETNRTEYNDVDDFNGLSGSVKDVLGGDLAGIYPNFSISITVFYDKKAVTQSNGKSVTEMMGVKSNVNTNAKRIVVTIVDPSGQNYVFSAVRGNF